MPKKTKHFIHRLARFFYRENLHRVLAVIFALGISSAIALWWIEPGRPLADWLWWSVVTLTTVGYGDLTPASNSGRLIGVVLMLSGIGVLGMFTATIASFFVELQLRRDRGMKSFELHKHYIFCEWGARAKAVYQELRSDPRTADSPILLLTDSVDSVPVDDDDFHFIYGEPNEENLERAGVGQASTVVVFGDQRLDPVARDAKVVLTALTIEHMNREVYTVVELVREENARHCERAHADEIIVGDQLSSRLLASAAIDHGLSRVLSELLSARYGNDLRRIDLPTELVGKTFLEVMTEMKSSDTCTVLSVTRGNEAITNPKSSMVLQAGDSLIVIASGRPSS